MATPSSRAVLRRPICSDSMSRLKGEYLYVCQFVLGFPTLSEGEYILNLDSIDVLDFTGAPQRVGTALRETEVVDLALVLKFLHLLDCLLDGSNLIKTVTVVEIDVRHAETPQ